MGAALAAEGHMTVAVATTGVLMRRAFNEVVRVPGAAIPGVLAPAIFMLGTTAIFGKLIDLAGFPTDKYLAFVLPVSMLQSASFSGAATGVNLARDIEQGWFDRMLVSPVPRPLLLAATVLSGSIRALMPITFTIALAFALGVAWPGLAPLLLSVVLAAGFAVVSGTWTCALALRFKTQAAAPLMQASMFMLVLFTTAFAPQELLSGFLRTVAKWNPVTQVMDGVRQGFVGGVSWGGTWPAIVVIVAMTAAFAALALREMARTGS
jgi:ABC-2 type transport system permease protein